LNAQSRAARSSAVSDAIIVTVAHDEIRNTKPTVAAQTAARQ